MPGLIKTFSDASILEYDKGTFDEWCIFLTRPQLQKYPPKDIEYFTRLQELGHVYSSEKIYDDFLKIYAVTTAFINKETLDMITNLSANYSGDSLEMDILFTLLYAGMVAEENKSFAILKKRIKRLGVHQVLIENTSAEFAANFSRNKSWRNLDMVCKEKGF